MNEIQEDNHQPQQIAEDLHQLPQPYLKSKETGAKDLPMIVMLKGDESFFSDFSWDAIEVMKVLGIKRSRLNQISGKELRVGKARIDRYLRPIYRPADVKDYLSWTRPTASHKRSSSIVEEARKKLEDKTDELISQITNSSDYISNNLEKILHKTIFEQFSSTQHKIKLLSGKIPIQLDNLIDFISKQISSSNNALSIYEETIEDTKTSIKDLDAELHHILQQVTELKNLQAQQAKEFKHIQEKNTQQTSTTLSHIMTKLDQLTPQQSSSTLSEKHRKITHSKLTNINSQIKNNRAPENPLNIARHAISHSKRQDII